MKFLATTAIEEFWDKNQKIIFLGEWCKLYNRRNEWMLLKYEDVPFVWENTDIILNGIEYCNKIYEKALIELTHTLNTYHGIEKDIHYYRIILGNWLFHFIHQLYDKYFTLKKVFEKYPNAQTWLLDEEQYYIPVAYNDWTQHLGADKYVLQLYSHIITAMGYTFEKKKLSNPIDQLSHYQLDFDLSYKSRLLNRFVRISSLISTFIHKKTITITAPYFSYNSIEGYLKILFKSHFRCILDEMRYKVNISFKIDQTIRKQKLSLNDDEFESVLSKILPFNIPVLFMEGFALFRSAVENLPIHKSKAFYTANALHGNHIFKYYVAEHHKIIKILDGQHGGGYGLDYINNPEEYERSVCDIFYTAGWKKDEKTIPLSVPKFSFNNNPKLGYANKILLVMNEMPRYLYRVHFHAISSQYLYYVLNPTLEFLSLCNNREMITIRSQPQHLHGWDTYERIQEHFDDCSFDDFSLPFNKQTLRSRILILTCAHTTYLEALAANKPTIMFLSKIINRFHTDAEPYFTELEKAKILHWSPESAAKHLNAVYDDVDTWWQSAEVQDARESFVEKYARSSPNWADEWVAEFNRVLAKC